MKTLYTSLSATLMLTSFLSFSNASHTNDGLTNERVVIENDTSSAHYFYRKAQFHQHRKDYTAAKGELQKVTLLADTLVFEANFQLGDIFLYHDNDGVSAISCYDKVLELDKTNHRALANRGLSNYKAGKYAEAINDFSNALKAEPKDSKIFFHKTLSNLDISFYRAESNIELTNYDEAISDLNSVIKENENYIDAYFSRAYVYFQKALLPHEKHKKDFELALADYDMVAKLDPNHESVYFDRGQVKMALGNYTEAITDFKKAIASNPNDLDAKYEKAMCNYHFGYSDIALAEFEEILSKDSSYVNAAYQIGVINYEIEAYDLAITAFKSVLAYDKDHSDVYYYLGMAHLELDNQSEACDNLVIAEQMGDADAKHLLKSSCPK